MATVELAVSILIGGSCLSGIPTRAESRRLPTLTSAAQVRVLSRTDANKHHPVHFRAVVTYFNQDGPDLFVQDGEDGIWVRRAASEPILSLGDFIDLQGVSAWDDFAPQINAPRYKVIGKSPLPVPHRVSLAELMSGTEDSQWVEAEGIIRQAVYVHRMPAEHYLWIKLAQPDGLFDVYVPWDENRAIPPGLVDARVRLRGACSSDFNAKMQLITTHLFMQSLALMTILERPDPNPFQDAATPGDRIQRFSPNAIWGHRIKIAGTVMALVPGTGLYVRDSTTGILVETRQSLPFKLGDTVEAIGFAAMQGSHLALEDAFARSTGKGAAIRPTAITIEEAFSGIHDSELVRISGLVGFHFISQGRETFSLEQNHKDFTVTLPPGVRMAHPPELNALIEVTGIGLTELDVLQRGSAVTVLSRSAADFTTLEKAPWFTMAKAATAIGVLAAASLLVLVWVGVLRRRVRLQTRLISRKLEEEASLKEAAQAANLAKSEFLANMSHELRTPMNGVLGMLQLALTSDLEAEVREYLEMSQTSAELLLSLIDDVLDLSKVEAGKMELSAAPFDLSDLLAGLIASFRVTAQAKGLDLKLQIGAEVPGELIGDGLRLRQVLVNLVGNALKFTSNGGVTIAVDRVSGPGNIHLRFAVIDTGIGIPADKHRQIFEAFEQADGSTVRKYGGTGLGLAISSRLVRLMGGTLGVESVPGHGATFFFVARFEMTTAVIAADTESPYSVVMPRR